VISRATPARSHHHHLSHPYHLDPGPSRTGRGSLEETSPSMSSPQRGLYGSDIGANMLRAGTADVFGTFLLVFTGTAVAVAGALSRAIAGQPADSLAVALPSGWSWSPWSPRSGRLWGPLQSRRHDRAGRDREVPVALRPGLSERPAARGGAGVVGGVGRLRCPGPRRRRTRRHHPRHHRRYRAGAAGRSADHVPAGAGHHVGGHRRPGARRRGPARRSGSPWSRPS